MRSLLLIVSVLTVTTSSADARHHHWRHHFGILPYSASTYGMAPSEDRATRRYGQRSNDMVDLVPPGWQLQPPDANWKGKRFLSPDGVAWFAAYATPVEIETVASHMKAIAFVDGETLTYLRGQEDWIAVSGFKGDRIIYRKAIIACAGKVWHHVAFEYPMALKREMDRFVISAADMIDRTKDTGCEDATSSTTPPTH